MNTDKTILCCECSREIPGNRIVRIGLKNENIICGSCIKENQGDVSYNFIKGLVDEGFGLQ